MSTWPSMSINPSFVKLSFYSTNTYWLSIMCRALEKITQESEKCIHSGRLWPSVGWPGAETGTQTAQEQRAIECCVYTAAKPPPLLRTLPSTVCWYFLLSERSGCLYFWVGCRHEFYKEFILSKHTNNRKDEELIDQPRLLSSTRSQTRPKS